LSHLREAVQKQRVTGRELQGKGKHWKNRLMLILHKCFLKLKMRKHKSWQGERSRY